MEPRPYQTQVVQDFHHAVTEGDRHCLAVLPTGSGKTVIAAKVTQDYVTWGKRVLFLAHRAPLITQAYTNFQLFGIDTGIIQSGQPLNLHAPVQVGQLQTLATGNVEIPDWDLLILDEAHYTSFFKLSETLIAQSWDDPRKVVLGLTATPYRLGKRSLGEHYTRMIEGPTVKHLTEAGFLVPVRYFGHDLLDLKRVGISSRTTDFDERQLQQVMNSKILNTKLAQEYKRLATHRRGIVFTVGIDHAKGVTDAFNQADIPSAYVDGTMSNTKREKIYTALHDGNIQVIVSVATLTEGYDEPTLECVVIARPTLSRALYMQMVGRGIRICPEIGKTDCIFYDFGTGNRLRFGRHDDPIDLHLDTTPINENPLEVINCPKCGAYITHRTRLCRECHTVLIEPIPPEELDPFEDVPDEAAAENMSKEEYEQCHHYRTALRNSYQNGYKPGWAALRFKESYGSYPPSWWGQGAIFGSTPSPIQQTQYKTYLERLAAKHEHDDQWVDRYLELEFGQGFNAPSLALLTSDSTLSQTPIGV